MQNKLKYLSLFLIITCHISFAQKKKADKYYDKLNYAKAIPAYEKAVKKNPKDQESLLKMADCYRILNNYPKAETYYKQAIDLGHPPQIAYYNYGNVLKCNNKYTEALNQYYAYLESEPTDEKTTKNAIKSCQEIKYWQAKPKEYEIKNLERINTMSAEFSPALYDNKLVFVGERVNDLVDFEKSTTNNQPYLNVFSSEIKNNEFSKTKSFSGQVNTAYHDGPICFTKDGKTAYFTRVLNTIDKKDKGFVNQTKIFITTLNGKSWTKAYEFTYNSDSYSCAHPSISRDGNYLYFASNMPGTMGGQDLWVSKRNGDAWGKPVNLGVDINTSGDELFPYIKNDTTLYFSSNGLPGFGDLDIFSGKKVGGRWLLRRNEGLFINSTADDFGLAFSNDTMGYFSSNREGGKGGDDLYSFVFKSRSAIVDGTVLLKDDINQIAKNLKIYLLDDKKKILDSTYTNNKGYFAFRDLETDKVYMAEVEETDANMKNKSRYYMADKNDRIARVTHNDDPKFKFLFKNLPIDPSGLPDLFDEDNISLAGNLIYNNGATPLPIVNKKVVISNSFGDVVEETMTDESGAFAFRNLPLDQNYTLNVDDSEIPANAKITLTNRKGKEVKIARSNAKGGFDFKLLNSDQSALKDLSVTDEDLIMALKGYIYDQDKKALNNTKLSIFSDGKLVETATTDDKGKFDFKNLKTDQSYLFELDENDPRFKTISKMYLADSKGRIYREINRMGDGGFKFELLELDKNMLGDFSIEDPWLEELTMKNKDRQLKPKEVKEKDIIATKEKVVKEKDPVVKGEKQPKETATTNSNGKSSSSIRTIYAGYNNHQIDDNGKLVLDKLADELKGNTNLKAEIMSHADSRGSDSYNMILSQKRSKAVIEYLVSKGVEQSRLKGIGYGETKLLNNCDDENSCSEEDHAKNRRIELKITETK